MRTAQAELYLVPVEEMLDAGALGSVPQLSIRPAVRRISDDAANSDGPERDGARPQLPPPMRATRDGTRTRTALTIHLSSSLRCALPAEGPTAVVSAIRLETSDARGAGAPTLVL